MVTRSAVETLICGEVALGFEPVRSAFERNFTERHEIGAACAIYHRGKKVVDLWGGFRDERTQSRWSSDTLVGVFSTTKGISALVMAVAHSKGLIEYDELVATYWPEFAQNGKARITVRQLLAHQAGLSAIDTALDLPTLRDPDRLSQILAQQPPAWEPGTSHGYHALSLGWYESELLRRVDPHRRTLGTFLQDEMMTRLGEEFYIGLPAHVPTSRLATIKGFHPFEMMFHMHQIPAGMVLAYLKPGSVTARTMSNPRMSRPDEIFSPDYRAVEMPSANGIGQVRSIAHLYSIFATDGKELGVGEKTLQRLREPAVSPSKGRRDRVLHVNTSYALGFLKPAECFAFEGGQASFGTMGSGGSFAFADPDNEVGFAYAMNRMNFHLWNDPREQALRQAFYKCL